MGWLAQRNSNSNAESAGNEGNGFAANPYVVFNLIDMDAPRATECRSLTGDI